MIAVDVLAGERRGRLFTRDVAPSDEALERAVRDFITEDDAERYALLQAILAAPVVEADLHPTTDEPGVFQVFVRSSHGPIFATTVISEQVLEQLLRAEPSVLEAFSLQVAPLQTVTSEALQVAIERWIERNFPGVPLPVVDVVPWSDTKEQLRLFHDIIAVFAAAATRVEGEFPETLTELPGEAA